MSDFKKGAFLYEGKAKKIYEVADQENLIWLEFKDSLTAFNAQKKGSFEGKGQLNRNLASRIFRHLAEQGIESHFVSDVNSSEMVVKKVEIIPLEVVVRNQLAGSTAKKFGFKDGSPLKEPLVEFYYKDDDLGDPFISDDQVLVFEFVKDQKTLNQLKRSALLVNSHLMKFFEKMGMNLIDFKLEFGEREGEVVLADEISPDSCRIWDQKTGEKLDKDRFRKDLGAVDEAYKEVWERARRAWGE